MMNQYSFFLHIFANGDQQLVVGSQKARAILCQNYKIFSRVLIADWPRFEKFLLSMV
jgi:hypothetical protein